MKLLPAGVYAWQHIRLCRPRHNGTMLEEWFRTSGSEPAFKAGIQFHRLRCAGLRIADVSRTRNCTQRRDTPPFFRHMRVSSIATPRKNLPLPSVVEQMEELMVSPAHDKKRHHDDTIALVPSEVPTVEVAWHDRPEGNATAELETPDPRFRLVSGANSPEIPVAELKRLAENSRAVGNSPSIGRRMFQAVRRFCIAALVGVGATLAWQSYGDQAKEMIGVGATSLGGLLFASTTKSSAPEVNIAAAPVAAPVQAAAQDAAPPQTQPGTQTTLAPPAQAAPPAESMQQLDTMARNLAVVQKGVEQLAAKQEEMAHNIATLQAAEQDIRSKMSPPPPRPQQPKAVPLPPRKKTAAAAPAQPPAAVRLSPAQPAVQLPPPPAEQASSPRPSPIPRPPVSLDPGR